MGSWCEYSSLNCIMHKIDPELSYQLAHSRQQTDEIELAALFLVKKERQKWFTMICSILALTKIAKLFLADAWKPKSIFLQTSYNLSIPFKEDCYYSKNIFRTLQCETSHLNYTTTDSPSAWLKISHYLTVLDVHENMHTFCPIKWI